MRKGVVMEDHLEKVTTDPDLLAISLDLPHLDPLSNLYCRRLLCICGLYVDAIHCLHRIDRSRPLIPLYIHHHG